MATTMPVGLLGAETLHARVEDIKGRKGAAPWVEKVVVNEQMSGTLICQPPGHQTDRHYHLVDEWWVVLEGEIDWEIEGRAEIVRARAGDIRPTGDRPSIRLAITPAGEFHRHDRPAGEGPNGR